MPSYEDIVEYARKKASSLGIEQRIATECITGDKSTSRGECRVTIKGNDTRVLIINYDCMLDLLENPTNPQHAEGIPFALANRQRKKRSDYFVSAVSKNNDEFIFIIEMTSGSKKPQKAMAQLEAGLEVAREFFASYRFSDHKKPKMHFVNAGNHSPALARNWKALAREPRFKSMRFAGDAVQEILLNCNKEIDINSLRK